jgi:hypothetical protein
MATSPEALLISAVLRGRSLTTAMAQGVTKDMFHAYPEEWAWIEEYFARYRNTPSKVAFKAKFRSFTIHQCDDIGHFADEVRKAHARQLMMVMMQEVADCLSDGDVDTAVKKATSSIIQVAADMGTNTDSDIFTDFGDVLMDVESRVLRVKEQGAAGVPCGFRSIDDRLGGFQRGELALVGARLGIGKSWFLQSCAAKAAIEGFTVQFDTLEMNRAQTTMRIHALMGGSLGKQIFSNTVLMQGKGFSLIEYKKFLRGLKQSVAGKLHVSDTSRGRVGVTTLASQIERNNPDILFVDYVGLLSKTGPDWQGHEELSGDLQSLATRYQIPIVGAIQTNREHGLGRSEKGPEAFAGSDAYGRDAAVAITLKKLSQHVMTAYMAKNRNGPSDFKFYMEFDPEEGILKEVSANSAEKIMDRDKDQADAEDVG